MEGFSSVAPMSMNNPFDTYPDGGRNLMGKLTGSNCRHEYGLKLFRSLDRKNAICVYCGIGFTDNFSFWMMMSVDHVVPQKVAEAWAIPATWYLDIINCVFCCRSCNELDNRNELTGLILQCPKDLPEFLEIRDKVFQIRYQQIAKRRKEEQEFYKAAWGGKV